MPRAKKTIIEFRSYELPDLFPIILLSGDEWKISDIPAGRLHFHNCLEIGICKSDSGTLEFTDNKVPFSSGDITFVASGVSHTTYSTTGTASKWNYIFVDIEELFRPFFLLNTVENGDIILRMIQSYSAIFSNEAYPEISMLVHSIIDEITSENINYQLSVRGLFLTLIMKILQIYMEETITSEHQIHQNTLVIAPALNYIHTNYMQEFTMDELAEMCHLSPTHFRRIFTSIMNSSPLEYLNHIRIQKATILLRTTEMPVLSISEEVGFRSLSSFNRHFQTDMNITPTDYRKHISPSQKKSVLKYSGWMTPPKS